MKDIPSKQMAVQLVGPDKLTLNKEKNVYRPKEYQILARIESVGLCFSDLKLLKQFHDHARKAAINNNIAPDYLDQIPSYVPGDKPTVPGHEAVVRIVEVGTKVTGIKIGGRYLVQTDYRWLPTPQSNASFGYDFEGGLQQYVLMDQRIITSPAGESMLIPASDNISASAVALVEPWACVEDAYVSKERTGLKTAGRMLVVADVDFDMNLFIAFLGRFGKPEHITLFAKGKELSIGLPVKKVNSISQLPPASFDDVIYFGSDIETAQELFGKVAARGLFNIVQCGKKFSGAVSSQVGRVHYGGIRLIGTSNCDPAESMRYIPASGEIRKGDKIDVIGAGGPMGVMHVVRNLCQGVKDVTVYAGDLDNDRLGLLTNIAGPMAQNNKVGYVPYNPAQNAPDIEFDYIALMAPVPKLVTQAVNKAADKGIINVFAGIPATVNAEIDLDRYIEKHLYFIGTSGSVLEDMKTVLKKVETGKLDTNISVAAVCGLDAAVEGIRAVENHLIPGKIIVYPFCKNLGLLTLDKLAVKYPGIGNKLNKGLWTKQAEQALLETCI